MTVSQSGPTEDLISTATTALRRLHFKTGRLTSGKAVAAMAAASKITTVTTTTTNGKGQTEQVVPKVVVMGSSTTSIETNINTSTDSSTTIITTMTATDNEGDSLDLIDTPIQSNQGNHNQNQTQENILTLGENNPENLPKPLTPQTSPVVHDKNLKASKFQSEIYDTSGKSQKFHGEYDLRKSPSFHAEFSGKTSNFHAGYENPQKTPNFHAEYETSGKSPNFHAEYETSGKSPNFHAEYETSGKSQNFLAEYETSGKSPNFHAEYETSGKSQNFLAEYETSGKPPNFHAEYETSGKSPKFHAEYETSGKSPNFHAEYETSGKSPNFHAEYETSGKSPNFHIELYENPNRSPKFQKEEMVQDAEKLKQKVEIHQPPQVPVPQTPLITPQTAIERPAKSPKFHAEMFNYEEGHIAKYTLSPPPPPLPDLRVDFFNEPEPTSNVCLKQCLRDVGASLETVSPINVTSNPIDEVYNRKATIVVQQPTSNEHCVILQNGKNSEFVDSSMAVPKSPLSRHLLEVGVGHLSQAEMHDFEMKYGSPHHSRSQSVKTPGRAGGGRPNYLCLPQQRSRVASMPNTGVEEEYYRLRHFSITGKGVVNRGDSLKSRRSRSNTSVASSNSSTEHIAAVVSGGNPGRTSAPCSLASSRESSTSNPGPLPYKVLMLGGPAVGKSSLVSQFMTSEYLHAYDTSLDDESGEKSVSVLLAGEESELIFIDHTYAEMTPEDCLQKYSDIQAFCVVYSSSDSSTFTLAETLLQHLWTLDSISTKAVILVANKADLVRSRVISLEEGKSLATSYDCKYIETSVGINHNVDELLVGLLTQIRLKLENPERTRDIFKKRCHSRKNQSGRSRSGTATPNNVGSPHGTPVKKFRGSRTSASLKVRGLLEKVWSRDSKSKSCENLHVL